MAKWWQVFACAGCIALAACGDDQCSAGQRVAINVMISGSAPVDKVTAELEFEEECGFNRQVGQVFTCWEQGGGTYTVRVYSGDMVHEEEIEIEADECHIKERATLFIDLEAEE